jgi:hypothetical protein
MKERQIADYNPQLKIMVWLEDEMKQLLYNNSMDPQRKLALFNSALGRFRNMMGNVSGASIKQPVGQSQGMTHSVAQSTPNQEEEGEQGTMSSNMEATDTFVHSTPSKQANNVNKPLVDDVGSANAAPPTPRYTDSPSGAHLSEVGQRVMANMPPQFWHTACAVMDKLVNGPSKMAIDRSSLAISFDGVPVQNSNVNTILKWLGDSKSLAQTRMPAGAKKFMEAMRAAGIDAKTIANYQARGTYRGLSGQVSPHDTRFRALRFDDDQQAVQARAAGFGGSGRQEGRGKSKRVVMVAPRPASAAHFYKRQAELKNKSRPRIVPRIKRGKTRIMYLY